MYAECSRGSNSKVEAGSIPAGAAVHPLVCSLMLCFSVGELCSVDFRFPDGGTSAEISLIASVGPSRDNSPDKALILADSADPPLGTTPVFAPVRRRPLTSTSQNNFKDLGPQQSARVRARPLAADGTVGTIAGTESLSVLSCQREDPC